MSGVGVRDKLYIGTAGAYDPDRCTAPASLAELAESFTGDDEYSSQLNILFDCRDNFVKSHSLPELDPEAAAKKVGQYKAHIMHGNYRLKTLDSESDGSMPLIRTMEADGSYHANYDLSRVFAPYFDLSVLKEVSIRLAKLVEKSTARLKPYSRAITNALGVSKHGQNKIAELLVNILQHNNTGAKPDEYSPRNVYLDSLAVE